MINDKCQMSNKNTNFISIIIPTIKISDYLVNKTIPALIIQTYSDFELILVTEKKPRIKLPNFVRVIKSQLQSPPRKRDLGANYARGEILAFIDSDVYPTEDWLEEINKVFENHDIAAVGGPGLTPPDDNLREKVSGYVWESWLGSGGAGSYRNRIEKERFVDDYPTFNLAIRKSDFNEVGGFDCDYWPGEDTKICHELKYRLQKDILYSPKCVVYHHRRPVFRKHLEQIGRYGFQRGRFVWLMPANNLKIGYFIPSIFLIITIVYWLNDFAIELKLRDADNLYYFLSLILSIYWLLVLIESIKVWLKSKKVITALLFVPSIFLTHVCYGYKFILGFLGFKIIKEKYCTN